jgi:hypothetical protein
VICSEQLFANDKGRKEIAVFLLVLLVTRFDIKFQKAVKPDDFACGYKFSGAADTSMMAVVFSSSASLIWEATCVSYQFVQPFFCSGSGYLSLLLWVGLMLRAPLSALGAGLELPVLGVLVPKTLSNHLPGHVEGGLGKMFESVRI